ncbi:amidohydrolase family protein [Actinomadura rubrisoli]|uniref:Amidohydrolase n=1 Tax=Actinomadura rubrisoli TaxID=2530368 RepID=A0A4R5BRF9_9ACTN|nr:amidohydrolase family protein [Actinomadura rubrisoli]TDD87840.1 amidohydrolase [Actinomadura rubrisoli]
MTTSRPLPAGRVVDVHAHAVPAALLAVMERGGRGSRLPVLTGDRRIRFGSRLTPPVPGALTDVRARIAEMDRTGVDLQVVSPWMELSPDELAPDAAAEFLDALDEAMAAVVAVRPDRLAALSLLDRQDPGAAALRLRRAAARPGFAGGELAAGGTGPRLDDRRWDPLWRAAADTGAPILLHPWRAVSPAGLGGDRLGDIVDNPAQSTAVVAAMILAGVLDRFPALRLCVVHGGGFLPYQAGRLDAIARLRADWTDDRVPPSTALRRLYYDSLTHSGASLSWLVDFAGSDHVVLGSDYPFPTGDPEAVAAVAAAPGLTPVQRGDVLGGTAAGLLGRRSLTAPISVK